VIVTAETSENRVWFLVEPFRRERQEGTELFADGLTRPFASAIPEAYPCPCQMRNEDHRARFLENYEKYVAAKHRGETEHIGFLALLALKEIHHISDVPAHADREANVQVMHDLLGQFHTEDEIREKYDQLRKDAGI
jgi:hypothetical protein